MKRVLCGIGGLGGLYGMFLPMLAAAADAPVKTTPAAVVTSSPLNLVLGLVFLLALIVFAAWLVKRMGGIQWPGARAMKVVAALSVGPRERVVLVEVGGQQLLLGVAPGCVNLLHRFDEPIVEAPAAGEDFASKIRQIMQQGLHK